MIDQEAMDVNCQQQDTFAISNSKAQEQSIQILSNLTTNSIPEIELSSAHDNSCSIINNTTTKSPVKG
jgi:hypothetical protein